MPVPGNARIKLTTNSSSCLLWQPISSEFSVISRLSYVYPFWESNSMRNPPHSDGKVSPTPVEEGLFLIRAGGLECKMNSFKSWYRD
jgi:hypothetical protein